MCARCGGLMYKPWDDDLGLRCWICGRSTLLTPRPATKADAKDSQHQQRVERGMDRWIERMDGEEGFAPKVGR